MEKIKNLPMAREAREDPDFLEKIRESFAERLEERATEPDISDEGTKEFCSFDI